MKIIIAGIGNIGAGLAGRLLNEGHDIVLVDRDIDRLEYNEETQDVMTVKGTCAELEGNYNEKTYCCNYKTS